MLDPRAREIYLDHLRPPRGYRLDGAVATTFSLDLMSLLMAPVAMALQDQRLGGQAVPDPVVVLEAIQQSADRFAVFCQQGRIAVPRQDTLLYGYLEPSVVEVQPPDPKGVFHPKTWLLRYESEDEAPVRYRFLCLSRNLTFDPSWDTVLALEGTLASHRTYGYSLTRPLAAFHQALPDLAVSPLPDRIRALVARMADEVKRVPFEVPEGFETIEQFIPLGIGGYGEFPPIPDHHRSLVLSPFLSPQGIERVRRKGREQVLISRADTLDGLSESAFDKLKTTARCYFLDEGAQRPEDAETLENREGVSSVREDLSGLHAKMILTETGGRATVYTGSANLTSAALNGRNVEFVVALQGYRRHVGIDRFLGEEDVKYAFRNMLRPYARPGAPPGPTEQEQLEETLETARTALTQAGLELHIRPNDQGRHALTLLPTAPDPRLPERVRADAFPITLKEHQARELAPSGRVEEVAFPDVTTEALTTFVAFRLEAKGKEASARVAFVLNLPASGMPEGRNQGILRSILSDRERFVRYLLLILGREESLGIPGSWGRGDASGQQGPMAHILPLFEELVRAYSRDPGKIEHIGRIVSDLRETGSLNEILPEGFEEVWAAFSTPKRSGNAV